MQQPKLSLFSAILINTNIMLGSGIFINTVLLTKQSGSLGAFVYALVALLLLPLILAISQLLTEHHKNGTFYHFGLVVSPFFGFLSSWSYFIAKMCSCTLGIHVCVQFVQQIIPALQIINTLVLDTGIIIGFVLLNLLHLTLGRSIQYIFMGLKLIPIFFAIFAGFFLFSGAYLQGTALWSGIPMSVPLVLYAFSGFEASCSLSSCLENPEKNGPRAILISYSIVVILVILYQLLFFTSLGPTLGLLPKGYLDAFPALLQKLPSLQTSQKNILEGLLHLGIAASSLGASYGILYSNSWNLYTLARNNHTFGKAFIGKLNKHAVPAASVGIEGLLALLYLYITQGQQIPLQQVSALGGTIAYTCSVLSLGILTYRKYKKIGLTALLGLGSCLVLIGAFVWSITTRGPSLLLALFLALIAFGSYMFYKQHEPAPKDEIFEDI